MDELYDDLENYNEEATIAELQSENNKLKSKLDNYATTLETLQKGFDKISAEYKTLETNYSSLLKTARAEIERKTQIITSLNLEKDKLILESYSRNKSRPYTKKVYNNPVLVQKDKETDVKGDKIAKDLVNNIKLSTQTSAERPEPSNHTSKITTNSHNANTQSKSLSMAEQGTNSSQKKIEPKTEKDSKAKEDLVKNNNNDSGKWNSKVLIKSRRLSMPAKCFEMEKISSDDDDFNSGTSSKDCLKENSDKRHVVTNINVRKSSRISETSSVDDRQSRYNEPSSDTRRSRHSRHKNSKHDKNRLRDKSSHRHQRYTPERHKREPKEYPFDSAYNRAQFDRYHRIEHGQYRSLTPPHDEFYRQRRCELMKNNERSHLKKSDRSSAKLLQQRSPERYPSKHKIQHNYDESDSKRIKIEHHSKQRDELPKLQDSVDNVNFSSCESPDYNHPDASCHQIKEIKLNASIKLDDPRISNKKYVLHKDSDNVTLSTIGGRDVNMVAISKIAWGIEPVAMPEALVQRPSLKSYKVVKDMVPESCTEVGILEQNTSRIDNITKNIVQEAELPVKHSSESTNVENLQKTNSYRIPKLKISLDDHHIRQSTKVHSNRSKDKTKKSDCTNKSSDVDKLLIQPTNELEPENKQDEVCIPIYNNLPCLGSSDLYDKHKYATAKEVLECDLEMSDDNCDNEHRNNVAKVNIVSTPSDKSKKHKDRNFETIKTEENVTKPNISEKDVEVTKSERERLELCVDKNVDDVKKTKYKKKSKRKQECDVEIADQILDKPIRKKDKEKETKTKLIKTKFSELFDDSNSLITPEDLGLVSASTGPVTRVQSKCVPFLENAQDAPYLINTKEPKDSITLQKPDGDKDIIEPDNTVVHNVIESNDVNPSINIESIYKNLEPSVPKQDNDVIKTIIISSGIQPEICVQNEKQNVPNNLEAHNKTALQSVALKALATSTPHKTWILDEVQPDTEPKVPETTNCNTSSNRLPNAENGPTMESSDTNNTLDSQVDNSDIPDVRIVVRRKRKVVKK